MSQHGGSGEPQLNTLDEKISIRGFFERVLAEQKEAREILSKETKEAMRIAEAEREKAAANVRRALEENMEMGDSRLQDHIDHQVEQVKQALVSLQMLLVERDGRMDDRFQSFKEAIAKADTAMTIRLEQMNQFRSQINQERANYITREFIDEQAKGTAERISRLENWQGKIVGGITVVAAIGVANFVEVWFGK